MKKIILISAALLVISFSVNAQNKHYVTVLTISTFQGFTATTQLTLVDNGEIKEQKTFEYSTKEIEKVLNTAIEVSKTIDQLSLQGYKIVATRSEEMGISRSNVIYLEKDMP